jgi:SOS-response transcriptional repressor LexA
MLGYGESMIRNGIFDRDYVVVRRQPTVRATSSSRHPGQQATVKIYRRPGPSGFRAANPICRP